MRYLWLHIDKINEMRILTTMPRDNHIWMLKVSSQSIVCRRSHSIVRRRLCWVYYLYVFSWIFSKWYLRGNSEGSCWQRLVVNHVSNSIFFATSVPHSKTDIFSIRSHSERVDHLLWRHDFMVLSQPPRIGKRCIAVAHRKADHDRVVVGELDRYHWRASRQYQHVLFVGEIWPKNAASWMRRSKCGECNRSWWLQTTHIKMIWTLCFPKIGWFLMYSAQNVCYLYVSRFLQGLCGGALYVLAPIFVAEISDNRYTHIRV